MNITDGYRWNVPVVTYGFDSEFINYFGSDGVAAVEEAIAILNALPPASEITLDDYLPETTLLNYEALALGLADLKSAALSALLEQLGLAEAIRNVWTLRSRTVLEDGDTNYIVMTRNFDPDSRAPSALVNGVEYSFSIEEFGYPAQADAIEHALGIPQEATHGVAGSWFSDGKFVSGLTRDDVGGLRFLLSFDNRNIESLLPGVTSAPGNTNPLVNVALRPGVEKLQFIRMENSSGGFQRTTNVFTDRYFLDGVLQQQQLQRVIERPDILFCAKDLGLVSYEWERGTFFFPLIVRRSDTSAWQNNAVLNESRSGAGPGTIGPPAEITFGEIGRYALSLLGAYPTPFACWGIFDESPDGIVAYPGPDTATSVTVSSRVNFDGLTPILEWKLLVRTNVTYRIESSNDLQHWQPAGSILNQADGFETFSRPLSDGSLFYRAVMTE